MTAKELRISLRAVSYVDREVLVEVDDEHEGRSLYEVTALTSVSGSPVILHTARMPRS